MNKPHPCGAGCGCSCCVERETNRIAAALRRLPAHCRLRVVRMARESVEGRK